MKKDREKEKDGKGPQKKAPQKKAAKKRGFFGRLIVFLLSILAFIGLLAMLLSVLSAYIDPVKFVWLTFFGLAFWVIVCYNFVVLTLLLLMWSKKAWISIIALLIAIPGFYKSFSTGKAQEGAELRIMSYNVFRFLDIYDEEKSPFDVATTMANVILEQQPDVLCLQEYEIFKPKIGRKESIALFGEMVGMPYQYYHTKEYFVGNVIFSKYPLQALDDGSSFSQENEYGAVVEVDAGEKGKFYVVCCHLTSFLLTSDEVSVFTDTGNSKQEMQEYGKSIFAKLKSAYEKRSYEVSKMLSDIPHDGSAIILCGDMNDTPMSYTYNQIKRAGFTDGFVETGWGIGHTYAGKLPLLRIDYVWGNERIQPKAFKRLKHKVSDHYPVMMDFKVVDGL